MKGCFLAFLFLFFCFMTAHTSLYIYIYIHNTHIYNSFTLSNLYVQFFSKQVRFITAYTHVIFPVLLCTYIYIYIYIYIQQIMPIIPLANIYLYTYHVILLL
jgi:hypothetical protein